MSAYKGRLADRQPLEYSVKRMLALTLTNLAPPQLAMRSERV
jgi:hypothetical protein